MNTKAKLRDYLRQARLDAALRSRLLIDARFSKKFFGWLCLLWIVLCFAQVASDGWQWFSPHSASQWLGLVVAVMLYDKASDRVAMLESLEEPPPESAPAPRLVTS